MEVFLLWLAALLLNVLQSVRSIDNYQRIDGHLDPDWGDYLALIQEQYDEVSHPPTPPWPYRRNYSSRVGWSLAGPGEARFLVALYSDKEPRSTSRSRGRQTYGVFDMGYFCGGALLSPNKVLTNCGCLARWYANEILFRAGNYPNRNSRTDQWTIQYDRTIYISVNKNTFVRDKKYRLVPFRGHEQEWALPHGRWHCPRTLVTEGRDQPALSMYLVGAPFEPAIEHASPSMFLPWPPARVDQRTQFRATSYIMGMWTELGNRHVIVDENLRQMNINYSTVAISWKQVDKSSCIDNSDDKYPYQSHIRDVDTSLACFNPVGGNPVLCGGSPGWPVMSGGWFLGLTAWSIPCRTDSRGRQYMPVALLDRSSRAGFVKFVGQKQLLQQNTRRPPLYREEPHFKNLVDSYLQQKASAEDVVSGVLSCFVPFVIYMVAYF